MRIGMIMDTPFPPDARVENEAKTLLESGYEVCLFCIDYTGKTGVGAVAREIGSYGLSPEKNDRLVYRQENIPGGETLSAAGSALAEYEYKGIRIYKMQAGRLLYKMSALAYTVPVFHWMVRPAIREFIRRTEVDALHIHDMVIAEAAFSANEAFLLPTVLDLHENRPEIMKLYKHVTRLPGRWLIPLERWRRKQKELMGRADHVILVTESARQWAAGHLAMPPEKTTALPNVVYPESFVAGRGDASVELLMNGRFTLLYIGDTSLRRGTQTLLEAVDRLSGDIPNLLLVFVGSSSQDTQLYSYVEEKGLGDYVRFEGWQDPERLPCYIHATDIGLSPLLRNLHHDTTYPNKLFQYMAIGKPVIASDCPAQAEVVQSEKCGVIFEAGNAADLAGAVLKLYRDAEGRAEMGRRGARAVGERWNWEVTGRELIAIYERKLWSH